VRELSLHILDLLQNGLEAGASRLELEINEDSAHNLLTITITDNGRGMDAETLGRVSDPFFTTRTTRNVGLGLPLFKAAAQRCQGDLTITSQPGVGTKVVATFQRDHVDRAPLGDLPSTLLTVILAHEECALGYRHRVEGRRFEFDTAEIRQVLGDVPLTHPRVRAWLEELLHQGYKGLYGKS
jgi:hypothetical protein